jgi:hypothetical protein
MQFKSYLPVDEIVLSNMIWPFSAIPHAVRRSESVFGPGGLNPLVMEQDKTFSKIYSTVNRLPIRSFFIWGGSSSRRHAAS